MNKYSLKKNVVHISVGNEDGNGTTEFQLREMSASTRDAYLDRLAGRVRIVNGQASGVAKFEGLQADLICSCLFRGDDTPVASEEIQKWPAGMVADLFKQAQDLNGLNKELEEAGSKNE